MNVTDGMISKFYNSKAWKMLRQQKLNLNPLCQTCQLDNKIEEAKQIHHSINLRSSLGWESRYNIKLLFSLCDSCHNSTTQEERAEAGHQFDEALRKAEG